MAVPRKLVVVPNAPNGATRELWRIAESGETDELEAVLSRADINARNEHGMTALMRAARHGRVQMVRVLLEHGADPNVVRNDNFTALSLAAFFGHAEIVEILISHGAKTDVATRFGTSPYIWARARNFGDVARSLERPRSVVPKPAPIVVKTLKDPPEIWDLVQEAPRNFDARAAFVARMGSVKVAVTIAVVLLIVISAGAGAMFYLKNRVRIVSTPAPAAAATQTAPVLETPAVATEPLKSEVTPTPNPITVTRRTRSFATNRAIPTQINNEPTPIETAVAQPTVAAPKPEPRTSATPDTKKPTPPLNSQIISPKTTQPKAKVIQWP
jgi:hypothetical protein